MPDPVAQEALDRALDDHEQLLLVYQPIHDARSGAIRAVEALLRQRRESGEIRDASIITEAAEESSSQELFTLDHLLVRRAYSDAVRWQHDHPEVRLNINLSPREFQEGNVLDRLTSLVTSCGINVHKVNLEITEASPIECPEETMDVLRALKKLGLALWLDDFGTGHSSLEHVQHFPLDGLKIGGAFVKELPNDKRFAALVRHIVGLAHDLGLQVVAEEVERKEQLEFLLDLDCDFIQGFYFSRPMTVDALQATLAGDSSGQ
ncbi:MAG TPA: EAL domain-containing protein [Thermoanaerobaculia bacterium]|nr:EAL domain-containing protein [Thermoanaerobaculia bacterium]